MILPDIKNWNDYFQARRRLGWMQRLMGGIPSVFSFLLLESAALSLPVFNPTTPLFGIDPLIAIGAGSLTGAVGSFLIGSSLFKLAHKSLFPKWHVDYVEREGLFARRVAMHRANVPPSPVQLAGTDFYGESVKSVIDYRRWLKRQKRLASSRTFNL